MDRMTGHSLTPDIYKAGDLMTSLQGVMKWQPLYCSDSDPKYLPLLVWLVQQVRPQLTITLGVGDGGAFFALCEAMQDLEKPAQCFGIDQWAPTEGTVLPAIPAAMKQHAQDHHAGLAKLIHADPAGVVDHFDLGGIDMLFADLDRAPDLLEQIQSHWFALMSDQSVIVLQYYTDTLAAGLAETLSDLCNEFPNFNMPGENGLNVLVLCKTPPPPLAAMCDRQSDQAIGMLRWLGTALSERQGHARALRKIAEMEITVEANSEALAVFRQQQAVLQSRLDEAEAREAAYIVQLAARDTALADLTRKTEALEQEAGKTAVRLNDTQNALRDMTAAAEDLRAEKAELSRVHDRALAEHDAALTAAVEAQHAAQAQLQEMQSEAEARDASHITQLAARDTAFADLTRKTEALEQEAGKTTARLNDTQNALRDMTAAAEDLRAEKAELSRVHDRALAEHDAALTAAVEAQYAAQARLEDVLRETKAREAAHITQLAARDAALAKAREITEAAEKTRRKLESTVTKLREELSVLTKQAEGRIGAAQPQTAASATGQDTVGTTLASTHTNSAGTQSPGSTSTIPHAAPAARGNGVLSGLRLRRSGIPSLRQQVRALHDSDYFDSAWYAATYPDCGGPAKAAEHYLREGAFVGNDPSPRFSTTDYYQRNPDVAATKWSALGHYIFYGKAEGRCFEPPVASEKI